MSIMYEVTKEAVNKNSFYVCLLEVPEFPFKHERKMDVVRNPLLAVIGAVYHDVDGWSFTALTKEEKHEIGDQLVELGANPKEWFACTGYRVDD